MNSPVSSLAAAAAGSDAATAGRAKKPAVRPAAALAALKARSVLAAPHEEIRKSGRPIASRLACALAASCARWLACRLAGDSGTGRNSPLLVESSLIGRRGPSG